MNHRYKYKMKLYKISRENIDLCDKENLNDTGFAIRF